MRVEHLVHARHAERGDVEHLGLAPLEQAGAVRGRDDADLGRQRPEVGRAAAVDADALVDDALADDLLGERAERRLDLLARGRRTRARRAAGDDRRRVASSVAALRSVLSAMRVGLGRAASAPTASTRVVRRRRRSRDWASYGDRRLAAAGLGSTSSRWSSIDSRIHVLAASRPVGDDLFGDLRGAGLVVAPGLLGAAGLDHHDGDVAVVELAAGDDDLERRLVALLVGGVRRSTRRRGCRRGARRRWGRRTGCPRASARPRRR